MAESQKCRDRQQMRPPPDQAGAKTGPMRDRHQKIRQRVNAKGFVTIEHLASEFGVTPQTIRRDINILSQDGSVHRYHGGAGVPPSTENVAYTQRKVLCLREKQQIAQMVASEIPDHASLFINIGTTTEEIAKCLCDHERLRVITNSLNVAAILAGRRIGFPSSMCLVTGNTR